MKTKLGIVGLGCRGISLLKDVVLPQGLAEVTAVCDVYSDRTRQGAQMVLDATGTEPKQFVDYRELIDCPAVEAVLIASAWENHVEGALYAMHAHKAVAIEVGGAYSLSDCFALVQTYEQTRTPFMFLENCCFGRREMMVRNMVEQGLFGEIVYAQGGYHHDLRHEVSFGRENRHYRLRNYIARNCENYPTHELGPIAKALGIHRGNRMVSLVSMASKAAGLHEYIRQNKPDDETLLGTEFRQGDVVSTLIRCARGETIALTLDTTLPRYYTRDFTIRGTKGMYEEATDSIFLDCPRDRRDDFFWRARRNGCAAEYEAAYEHPVWREYLAEGIKGGHDGMDWLTLRSFFTHLQRGEPMEIDVYDAAAWMSITALSAESIARGNVPVEIPDFTANRG
ncbi:MAG: Gfo/Idh/MocA family oxidoreductase [Firmicutes bacterium]|nr:Gfo/Idh/MocA family oxidoreductase [Bacillota bacterium]